MTGLIDLDQEKSIVPVGRVRACSSAWRTESIALTNQRYGSGDCRGRPAGEHLTATALLLESRGASAGLPTDVRGATTLARARIADTSSPTPG